QQFPNFLLLVSRHSFRVKSIEHFTIAHSLSQNRVPAQSRLRSFEDEEFEQQPVVMHRNTPFLVVIGNVPLVRRPAAPLDTVFLPQHRGYLLLASIVCEPW